MKKIIFNFLLTLCLASQSHPLLAVSFWDAHCINNYGFVVNDANMPSMGFFRLISSKAKSKPELDSLRSDTYRTLELCLETIEESVDSITDMLDKDSPKYNCTYIVKDWQNDLKEFLDSYSYEKKLDYLLLPKILKHLKYYTQVFTLEMFQSEFEQNGEYFNDYLKNKIHVININIAAYKKFVLYATGFIIFPDKVDVFVYTVNESEKIDGAFKEYCEAFERDKIYLYDTPTYTASKRMLTRSKSKSSSNETKHNL